MKWTNTSSVEGGSSTVTVLQQLTMWRIVFFLLLFFSVLSAVWIQALNPGSSASTVEIGEGAALYVQYS